MDLGRGSLGFCESGGFALLAVVADFFTSSMGIWSLDVELLIVSIEFDPCQLGFSVCIFFGTCLFDIDTSPCELEYLKACILV